jgi:hypothetical protein
MADDTISLKMLTFFIQYLECLFDLFSPRAIDRMANHVVGRSSNITLREGFAWEK